jgi:hypothetical protein
VLHTKRGLCVRFLLENSRFNVFEWGKAALDEWHSETIQKEKQNEDN